MTSPSGVRTTEKKRHAAKHPTGTEAISQSRDVVYPVQHGQYRAGWARYGSEIVNCSVEVVGLACDEHDVVRPFIGAGGHGLDRCPELIVRSLDDEPAFGELCRPRRAN